METPATMAAVEKPKSLSSVRVAAVAWILTSVYYFYQYALRSAPAVMMPELSNAFGITPLALASMVGLFYYGYSPFSLVAGAAMTALDHAGCYPAQQRWSVSEHCCSPAVIVSLRAWADFSREPAVSLRLSAPSTSPQKIFHPPAQPR